MSPEHLESISIIVATGKLVMLSIIIERGLAVIYEYYWFTKWNTPKGGESPKEDSRFPGLKGAIALIMAIGLCFYYEFDILAILFRNGKSDTIVSHIIGMVITGLFAAGGSSGAMAVFQVALGISKESRDAKADATKAKADAESTEAKAKQAKAEAEIAEAKAKQAKAEAEVAVAEAKKKLAGG